LSAFVIARVKINDPAQFKNYEKAFAAVFGDFKAEVLVADDAPRVLEGEWPEVRTVVIRFDDETEALRWYFSDAYEAAKNIRAGASATDMILAKGL
jgi:uncharacterized protein (DUF1330 family)